MIQSILYLHKLVNSVCWSVCCSVCCFLIFTFVKIYIKDNYKGVKCVGQRVARCVVTLLGRNLKVLHLLHL